MAQYTHASAGSDTGWRADRAGTELSWPPGGFQNTYSGLSCIKPADARHDVRSEVVYRSAARYRSGRPDANGSGDHDRYRLSWRGRYRAGRAYRTRVDDGGFHLGYGGNGNSCRGRVLQYCA